MAGKPRKQRHVTVGVIDLPAAIRFIALRVHTLFSVSRVILVTTYELETFLGTCELQPMEANRSCGTEFSPVTPPWKTFEVVFDALGCGMIRIMQSTQGL